MNFFLSFPSAGGTGSKGEFTTEVTADTEKRQV
jgi:hypothetical protein